MPDCPIANGYAPEIQRLAEEFASRQIAFYLVHVDRDLSVADARRHAEEFGLTMPVLLDADHRLVEMAGATRVPEAAVFLPNATLAYRGRIDDRYVGYGKRREEPTVRDLRAALEAVLAGQPVSQPWQTPIGCHIPE